jgi:hypothetical protein
MPATSRGGLSGGQTGARREQRAGRDGVGDVAAAAEGHPQRAAVVERRVGGAAGEAGDDDGVGVGVGAGAAPRRAGGEHAPVRADDGGVEHLGVGAEVDGDPAALAERRVEVARRLEAGEEHVGPAGADADEPAVRRRREVAERFGRRVARGEPPDAAGPEVEVGLEAGVCAGEHHLGGPPTGAGPNPETMTESPNGSSRSVSRPPGPKSKTAYPLLASRFPDSSPAAPARPTTGRSGCPAPPSAQLPAKVMTLDVRLWTLRIAPGLVSPSGNATPLAPTPNVGSSGPSGSRRTRTGTRTALRLEEQRPAQQEPPVGQRQPVEELELVAVDAGRRVERPVARAVGHEADEVGRLAVADQNGAAGRLDRDGVGGVFAAEVGLEPPVTGEERLDRAGEELPRLQRVAGDAGVGRAAAAAYRTRARRNIVNPFVADVAEAGPPVRLPPGTWNVENGEA